MLAAQMRQRRPIDPLGAENVDVILLDQLFEREGFGRAEHHVAGIMDDHIEAPGVGDDAGDTGINRGVGLHVQLDGAQIRFIFGGPGGDSGNLWHIAACGFPH
jgi:hypothetical protein